jgi:L-lactate dehydrogenase (cytochrome)
VPGPMTGSAFRLVAPPMAGGLAAASPDPVVGLPEAVGLPDVPVVVDDDDDDVLDPHAASTTPTRTITGSRSRRTRGQTSRVDPARIFSVGDARRRAARTIPRALFDYVDGGAEDETTLHENERAFRDVTFRPRMAVAVGEPRTSTTLAGTPLSMPVLLAPCGLVRFMHPDGSPGVARAAAAMGTVSVLSTVAGNALEDVATAATGPMWFQLYSPGGLDQSATLVDRAQRAGYAGLVLTLDTPALGHRERDIRHGVAQPFRFTPSRAARLAAQVALRPRWTAAMVRAEAAARSPRAGPGADEGGAGAPAAPTARLVAMGASPFSWGDVAAVRRQWSGPLGVKGILGVEDARRAVDAGSDIVIVSNHGGRQLDGAPATLRVLPGIADALAGAAAVVLDSGIRRGSDVVKALAAGADAVMIGRAYLYGLATCGEPGVRRVLEIIRTEMVRTMTLMGCPSIADLDRSWIDLRGPEGR